MKPAPALLTAPLLALSALMLSACISFGAEPPPFLLTLSADQQITVGADRTTTTGQGITISEPSIPQKLATNRLAVATGPTTVAYFPNALWSDSPAALFRSLLSEVIAARTGRVVLDPRQYSADPGTIVTGQLHEFGYDSTRRDVVIRYDAAISGPAGVRTRRFETREPVAFEEAQALSQALNTAANRVATEVADWVAA